MSPPDHALRFSFQTKVLLPVLAALVLLPAITLMIVNRTMSQQVQNEAHQTLTTARAVFLNSLELRSRNLVARFRAIVNRPYFRPMVQKGDPTTLNKYLSELLEELRDETELIIVTTESGKRLATAGRYAAATVEEFEHAADPVIRQALAGELSTGVVSVDDKTCNVISVPMLDQDAGQLVGAVTIISRLSESTMRELKSLTGADILIVAGKKVSASTIRLAELPDFQSREGAATENERTLRIMPIELQGEHYLALTDDYERIGPEQGFHYVLLSSFEQRLREQQQARNTLLAVSLIGVMVSGFLVWILIRRITQPLVELRDNAEAVGRGDFTRRMAHFSNDECGAVAVAFNGMTDNLQASRAELEKAVGSLKTAQAQLIQGEKLSAVGQFVAGIAHELNNPLTVVIGFSDLLLSSDVDPQYKDQLTRISKSATRCHKIVNSLLGFSRQHEPERKLVRLNELADAVVEIVAYDLRSSNIALVKEYQPDLPAILGDFHQLQQVVLNIISNARQATEAFRRDGQIVLRTGLTDTHVWLRIKDNGPGMTREILSRIFDPFFTTKPQGKGTGLGLSLSYGIMQEHHGRIRAESQPGEGTEFILELPLAEPGAVAARAASAPPIKTRTAALHVLVVDDEESILHLIREILQSDGHQVSTATSGQAALELIALHRYDAIISDWKMPGLNGINLFQELLEKNPVVAKRMLFMTGDVLKDTFQQFLRQHALVCLPKPFSLREFHSAIAGIVNAG